MDEVHIRSNASYKGGKIIVSIDHPEDPPTTVFSMMVSSFMKNFSTIVRLVPLDSSSATNLFTIVTKLYQILKDVIYMLTPYALITTH